MSKPKILVADKIADKGIADLQAEEGLEVVVQTDITPEELLASASEYSGIIVRSRSKVPAAVLEAATSLKAVGRAGVGVNNIDLDAATKHGVVVMNTPTGNTVSTAEHAFTLMLSLARKIPQAHAHVLEKQEKWKRNNYQGVEIQGKTLSVLGMGRIGSEFAKRATAFGMKVVAYDPYLSKSRAEALKVEVVDELEDALKVADFVTLHMPVTPETTKMLNKERIALMKPEARVVNCARGELVDEEALADALKEGRLAGAALDVFSSEPPAPDCPFFEMDNVVMTPHLGASTEEAQESVGIEIAQAIRDYLLDGVVTNAVNMPSVDEKTMAEISPYMDFAVVLGRLLSQIVPPRPNVLRINYMGKLGGLDTTLISRAALKGFLEKAVGESGVNPVNAMDVAENLGLRFTESHLADPAEFTDLIEVVAGNGTDDEVTVSGTMFGGRGRIVKINGRHVEAQPEGCVLMLENTDRPGMIGAVGMLLGNHSINIANMSLSRNRVGGRALTVLNLDSVPGDDILRELEAVDGIIEATCAQLG